MPTDNELGVDNNTIAGGTGSQQIIQQLQALYAQNYSLRQANVEMKTEIRKSEERLSSAIREVNRNVFRIALQPGTRRSSNDGGNLAPNQENNIPATLSRSPRDLFVLWQEYMFGIAGRKPAKQFSAKERGRCKYTYNCRKIAWEKIAELVRAGLTVQVAIDRIYDVYGRRDSLTRTLLKMRHDRRVGWPDDLILVHQQNI